MKKFFFFSLFLALLSTSYTHVFADVNANQLAFGKIAYGASIQQVESSFGKPYKIETEQKPYGEKKTYKYPNGLEIKFINGVIREMELEDSSTLSTADGVHLGDNVSKVVATYGEPGLILKEDYIYYLKESGKRIGLKFTIKRGIVDEIKCGDFD